MNSRFVFFLLILLCNFAFTSCFSPKPEDSVRAVYNAAVAKEWATFSRFLSGAPLRSLLQSGSKKNSAFGRFCNRVKKSQDKIGDYSIYFTRARYFSGCSEVVIHFVVKTAFRRRVRFIEYKWRLRVIRGVWKIVSFVR